MNDPFDVAFADRMASGCAIHSDPGCLCDVDRERFVCGDGPYKIPLFVSDLFVAGDPDWLEQAMRECVRLTALPPHLSPGTKNSRCDDALRAIDQNPDLIEAIKNVHDSGETFKELARRFDVDYRLVTAFARMLAVRPFSRQKNPMRAERERFLHLYDVEGMSVMDALAVMAGEGMAVGRSTAYQWVQRHSERKWQKVAA